MSYVDDRPSAAKSIASHAILIAAVVFALYPILWVISLAFSAGLVHSAG